MKVINKKDKLLFLLSLAGSSLGKEEKFSNQTGVLDNNQFPKATTNFTTRSEDNPDPKVFFLYHTKQSTIFKDGALIIQAAIRSLPNNPLLIHNKQKLEGFNILPTCSIIRIIW